jgi:hypothetical protein
MFPFCVGIKQCILIYQNLMETRLPLSLVLLITLSFGLCPVWNIDRNPDPQELSMG